MCHVHLYFQPAPQTLITFGSGRIRPRCFVWLPPHLREACQWWLRARSVVDSAWCVRGPKAVLRRGNQTQALCDEATDPLALCRTV